MIVEFLGVPGIGKTYLSKNFSELSSQKFKLILGQREYLDSCKSANKIYLFRFLKFRFTQIAAVFFAPVAFIVFYEFFYSFAKAIIVKKRLNFNSIKNLFYQLLAISYQLLKHFFAKLEALHTKKTVIIDEGLLYSYIRFITFTDREVANYCKSKLLYRISLFGNVAIILKGDVAIASARFFEREGLCDIKSQDALLNKWHFTRVQYNDFVKNSWNEMQSWFYDFPSNPFIKVIYVDLINDFSENLTYIERQLKKVGNDQK
jgi:hypothetical protein